MIQLYRNPSCCGWHIHPEDRDADFGCWWAVSGQIKLTKKSKLAEIDPNDFLKAWAEGKQKQKCQIRNSHPPMVDVVIQDLGRICCVCAESLIWLHTPIYQRTSFATL